MEKESIRQNVLDYRELLLNRTYIPRDLRIDHEFARETGKVTAIVGPRRAGKSTILLQLAEEMGLSPEARIHADFSEITWATFAASDPAQWRALYEVALEYSTSPVFLLDEIQELAEWASGLIYLVNRGCRVIVTGSNRALFSRGLASSLRGKVLLSPLYPLTFPEYLRFRDAAASADEAPTSTARARRRALLADYLAWGGFPEVVLATRDELKRSLLESYLDVMLFRDVVERYDVQNLPVLQELLRKVLLSFTKEISVNRWYNDMKSRGLRVGKDTLYEYLACLEEAQFLILLENLAAPKGLRKAFLIDNGYYRRAQIHPDTGKLLENRVCLDLYSDPSLRFYRDSNGEIHFVTDSRLVQVCAELTPSNTDREWLPLQRLSRRFPEREAGVVSLDSYPETASGPE